jgi:hypothetical protein
MVSLKLFEIQKDSLYVTNHWLSRHESANRVPLGVRGSPRALDVWRGLWEAGDSRAAGWGLCEQEPGLHGPDIAVPPVVASGALADTFPLHSSRSLR